MRAYASLREYFDQTGTRQEEVAADLGISGGHLSNIVNGKRVPRLRLAMKISEVTNVPIQAICSDEA